MSDADQPDKANKSDKSAKAGATDKASSASGSADTSGLEAAAPYIVLGVALLAAVYFTLIERPAVSALIIAAVTLLATVFALWNSVRALAGDGDLSDEFKTARFEASTTRERLLEQKKSVLRALKDLENERDIGKITEEDYEDVAVRYRDEAKAILRELDDVSPEARQKAEELAEKHLLAKGLLTSKTTNDAPAESAAESAAETAAKPAAGDVITAPPPPQSLAITSDEEPGDGDRTMVARHICPSCAASNEFDAKFCKACAKPMSGTSAS